MKQAFTLIELLVVVLIIGILSAIALPQYEKAVEKTRAMQGLVAVKHIVDAQKVYYLANNEYADNLEDLGVEIPSTNYFLIGAHKDAWPGSIAYAIKLDVTGRADYAFEVYASQPDTILCVGQYLGDKHDVCKMLSGGAKKTVKGVGSFYFVNP